MANYNIDDEAEKHLSQLKHMFDVDSNAEVLKKCLALAVIISKHYHINDTRDKLVTIKKTDNTLVEVILNV